MFVSMILCLFASVMATALGGIAPIYKSPELSHYDVSGYGFDSGHNNIEESYSQYSHYAHLPAYSTVSYVMASGNKPVSYSGFTNHGRGHHDPGYTVQYRSDGFLPDPHHNHHHYHEDYHHDQEHDYEYDHHHHHHQRHHEDHDYDHYPHHYY